MNLDFDATDQAFRQEVREFLDSSLPADLRKKVLHHGDLEKDDILRWQAILHKRGWAAPAWPKVFGGTGWSPVQRYIFDEETTAAGAPMQLAFGLMMVAPVIMAFGSIEQQTRFLPRILSGEDWWCQGYSEPGAGSDLASLRTRAERQGDRYLVNGHKTWNTLGQHADWIFCLVRTSTGERPQNGISFLLIDMKSPGVSVRPIRMLDGGHEINDVFFDDVEVPLANLVGEENKGWSYAKFLLGHERTGLNLVAHGKRMFRELKALAAEQTRNGRPLIQDQRFRDRLARVEIELAAHEITLLRVVSASAGKQGPGPEASILKIKGTEIVQTLTELVVMAGGELNAYADAEVKAGGGPMGRYFNMRKLSIFGGANEIQKNIIAQMILGL